MGTNYYTEPLPPCEKCARPYEGLHLGKSSMGWPFMLQANGFEHYKDWSEMKLWLQGQVIKNEYGEAISVEDFIKMVESRRDVPDPEPVSYGSDFSKINGYRFLDCNFS